MTADGTGAAPTIQAGIDSAATNDTILVAHGTYYENLLLTKSLTLLSTNGPETTIIDGGRRARVLTIDGEGGGPMIAGFTLRNGQSPDQGGGVWIGRSGTTLRGNVVESNVAGSLDIGQGGGIYVDFETTTCLIEENVIRDNLAGSEGGGILARGSEVRRNFISRNASHVAGGGAHLTGSKFTENIIANNYSDHYAGGVVVNIYGELLNNTIVNNRIANTDRVPAGVDVWPLTIVRNNIVAHNTGGTFGVSQASGIQCRVFDQQSIVIDCNDVWGNDVDEIRCSSSSVWPDNFSANPLFCNEASGDFHVSDTSPCAAPNSACGLVGAMPPQCHVISVLQASWTLIKNLYR